jgi:glycosyltransferase involved in cell wall biosynthesis
LPHALFIAFHFPPEASSSGVLRTLKYARYLADYGWRVTVVAPRSDAYTIVDPQLESQVPTTVKVLRTPWINTKKHLSIYGRYPALLALPDTWIGWLPWAVSAGRRVLRDDPPDLIYSTSPHATTHLIALALVRAAAVPWVTDFRDPWFEDPPEPGAPAGPVYTRINRLLERRVIERCSHVVTSTTHLRDILRERYPHVPPVKISAILNGYDEADFTGLPAPASETSESFLIVHAGSINADFRDPLPLLRALRRAIAQGKVEQRRLRLRFIGPGEYGDSVTMRSALAETGLAPQVEFVARVPYEEALRELGRADLLLLLQASADTVGLVPAKLYEYLRAQKPVLALVQPGATSEVLAATGGGWAVDPRDAAALEKALAVAYAAWADGTLPTHCASLESLRQFERRTLAGQLAALFAQLSPADVG